MDSCPFRPSSKTFLLPVIVLFIIAVLFHEAGIDEMCANFIYSPSAGWYYRNNFIFEKIFHKGGVILTEILLGLCLLTFLYLWKKDTCPGLRRYLSFVLVSSILTLIIVKYLKSITTLSCPWDAVGFGGTNVRLHIWQMFSPGHTPKHCFPAGHASAGYALLSFYYAQYCLTDLKIKKNLWFILPGILLGLLFGITQQFRGAHFVSHDIVTIIVSIVSSWITSWFFYYFYYKKRNIEL